MSKKPLEAQTPEELIAYIRQLRDENRQLREESEPYTDVFQKLPPAEQRGLLHVIRTFVENEAEGAQMFVDLGAAVLGSNTPTVKQETKEADMPEATETPTDDTPTWAQALVAKIEALESRIEQSAQSSEAAEIERYKAAAREMGFEEGTPGWVEFFKIAANMTEGDLDAALGIYAKLHPEEFEEAPEGEAEAEGEDETSTRTFPKTGAASVGAGSPGPDTEADGPLDVTKRGTARAALDFIEAIGKSPLDV